MQFQVNAQRLDPYKSFKFRLRWDGRHVAGGGKITGLAPASTIAEYRAGGGGSPTRNLGRSKYPAVTLERGVTFDSAFNNWATQVSKFGSSSSGQTAPANFRKDIYLEIYNEAGQLTTTYQLSRCWVSGYKALPKLGGNSNAVAIEHIHIENEGFLVYRPSR